LGGCKKIVIVTTFKGDSYLVRVINYSKWIFRTQPFEVIKKVRCCMCLRNTSKSLTTIVTCYNWIYRFKRSCEVFLNKRSCFLITSFDFCSLYCWKRDIMFG